MVWQAKLTDHAIEGAIGEAQGLAIHRGGSKAGARKPSRGRIKHRRRDVDTDHESSGSDA